MPSSRQFLGSIIPRPDLAHFFVIDSGGANLMFQNIAPSSGGTVHVICTGVSSSANTLVSTLVTPATMTTQGITGTTTVNSTGSNAAIQNATTFLIETVDDDPTTPIAALVGDNPPYLIWLIGDTGGMTVTDGVVALNEFPLITDVATFTGSGSSILVNSDTITFSGATDSLWDLTTGVYTPTTVNGTQFPGQSGQFTSTGTLPAGISELANYYAYPINDNNRPPTNFQFFTAAKYINNAIRYYRGSICPPDTSGLLIPTDIGTVGATLTWTPTSLSGATYKLQQSNSFVACPSGFLDYTDELNSNYNIKNINELTSNFVTLPNNQVYSPSNSVTVSTAIGTTLSFRSGCSKWMRTNFAMSAGSILVQVVVVT